MPRMEKSEKTPQKTVTKTDKRNPEKPTHLYFILAGMPIELLKTLSMPS